MAKHHYYVEDELFAEFRERYPDLWTYGTTYYGAGFQTIRIRIPNKGCVLYNRFANSLTWIDHNGDKEYEKEQRKKRRENMYRLFMDVIQNYQNEYNVTQNDIAKKTGVSRRKINEYINGKAYPKINTMQNICKSLGIDIYELERRNKHVE